MTMRKKPTPTHSTPSALPSPPPPSLSHEGDKIMFGGATVVLRSTLDTACLGFNAIEFNLGKHIRFKEMMMMRRRRKVMVMMMTTMITIITIITITIIILITNNNKDVMLM